MKLEYRIFFKRSTLPARMPAFVFDTNLPKDKIPEGFMEEMTDILHKILGKPKKVEYS